MDYSGISTVISTLGFPIAMCILLFAGCKYMLDNQQKNTDKMFEMYEKSNTEIKDLIKSNTDAINKLCEKLDDVRG